MDNLVVMEVVLFLFGFVYGFVCGNDKMNPILRALCGGIFFALFFVSVPLTLLLDVWDRNKS